MMEQAIRDFPKQFEFEPKIENAEHFRLQKKFAVLGMGGSGLAGSILKDSYPEFDLIIHKDYGLPALSDVAWKDRLVIANSYSGNTEETLEGFEEARSKGLPLIAISVGGKLIELSQKHNVPYIKIPDTGIQPRMALGFAFNSLIAAMGYGDILKDSQKLAKKLNPEDYQKLGKRLSKSFKDFVPVIYSSARNYSIAYNWKIKLNETGKIPSFYNVLPELNHNEMTGFDVKDSSRTLSERMKFIFLKDGDDHPQIQKRMDVLKKLYSNRGLEAEIVELKGGSRLKKIFSSLLTADWFALYTAREYGLEEEQVPMVEEFKKLIG